VLYLSDRSHFAMGQPIRGGVPVCHPWFGQKPGSPGAPMHGYVRLMEFDVESLERDDDGVVTAVLWTKYSVGTTNWPGDFELRNRISLGESLDLSLETRNCGQADLTITEALHSYFRVSDAGAVLIRGLEGRRYVDKAAGGREGTQPDEPLALAGEVDRVYLDAPGECVLDDPGLGRSIRVSTSGSNSTVVWNPGPGKAKRLDDFGDDDWRRMVCIETANALTDAVTIAPGGSHTMTATIRVEPPGAEPAPAERPAANEVPRDDAFQAGTFNGRIHVQAHTARVFEAWATGPGLSRWLLGSSEFRAPGAAAARADAVARSGDDFRWTFQAGRCVEGHVLAAEWPGEIELAFDPGGSCRVSLAAEGDGTLVEVVHLGLGDPAARLDWSTAWTFFLTNLKSVLEGGADLRETDPARGQTVNQ